MTTTAPYTPRRATRDTSDSYLGGVASGLARHLGVPVLWVRVLFVVTAALGGMGMAFYAGLWLVLPTDERFEQGAPGLDAASRDGRRPGAVRRFADVGPMIALAALGVGIVLMFESVFGRGALFWPIALGIGGVVLIWRQADEAQRERWVDTTGRIDPLRALVGRGTWASYARLFAGGALILGRLDWTMNELGAERNFGWVAIAIGAAAVIGAAIPRVRRSRRVARTQSSQLLTH